MKPVHRQLLALLLTVVLDSVLCLSPYVWDSRYTCPGAQPMDGLLTLTGEELGQTDFHLLIYGWVFYPDVLFTSEGWTAHGAEHHMTYASIGEHTRSDQPGGVTPHDYGTYVLTLGPPEDPVQCSLEPPEIYPAYWLYLDGNLELQVGRPDSEHYQLRTQDRMVILTGSGLTTILLTVRGDSHLYSGLVYPPALGTPLATSLNRGLRLGLAVCVTLCGVLGVALVAYFGVWMRHKNALLFALLCLAGSLFTTYPTPHSAAALPPRPWHALEIPVDYAMVVLVVTLQNRPCQTRRPVTLTVEIAGWLFCLTALYYELLSPYLTTPVMKVFSLLIFCFKIGSVVCLLGATLRVVRQQAPQAVSLFFTVAFYVTPLLQDKLLSAFESVVTGWFGEWNSFAMTLAIGYTLWRDIISAYHSNLTLTVEYRQIERRLAMQVEHADQLAQRFDEDRRLIYDFCQHLRTTTELAGQIESRPETEEHRRELLCYLEDFPSVLTRRPGMSPSSFYNRAPVDALLQYYSVAIRRREIRVDLALTIPARVSLGDVEWCTVLSSLPENALEAYQRQSRGERRLSFTSWATEGILLLLMENTYDGWFDRPEGHVLSRRARDVCCGIGLNSVQETVGRHGGMMNLYLGEDVSQVGITLPIHNK